VREGKSGQLAHFPYILGRDFSGRVSAIGKGVEDFRVGDEVFGVCDVGQEGAYAEKIAIKAAIVAKKTDSLSHVDAAALALAGLTAICTVEDALKLKAGETILIQGGAGGVASFAIQLAKHLGARVITTASRSNHDYLREIGADEIIDYNAVDFTKVVSDCDAVFDTVGGDVAQRSFAVLKPGGRAAFIASGPQAPKPDRGDVVALRPSVGRDRPHLERIVALAAAGAVRPPEVTRYKLSEAVAAHEVSQSRHFRGKLVFLVR
jgi:NADPH:quinone reductase-like Zn-dependent oxidoreductase